MEENHQKHPCLSFRLRGTLQTFSQFAIINQAFKEFFETKNPNSTPIHHKSLNEGLTFEFYQDAMIKGLLVNTTSKDTSRITHPTFFKNLVGSCVPLSHFFQVDPISSDDKKESFHSQNLLGISSIPEEKYSLILVLDYRNKSLSSTRTHSCNGIQS